MHGPKNKILLIFVAQSVRLLQLASVWLEYMINKSTVLENITIPL